MLRTLPDFHKNEWKYHFKKLVFTCKHMKHSTSGYLPYYISLIPPIDIILPTYIENIFSHKNHIQN